MGTAVCRGGNLDSTGLLSTRPAASGWTPFPIVPGHVDLAAGPYGWCSAEIAAAVGDDRLAPRPTIIRVGDDDWLGLWTWIGVVPNVKAVMKRSGCSVDSHERLFGPNGRGLDHTGIPPVLTLVSGLCRHHLGAEACSRGSERRVTLVELTSIVVYRPRPEAVGVWWGHHRRQERYRPGCARVLANEPG